MRITTALALAVVMSTACTEYAGTHPLVEREEEVLAAVAVDSLAPMNSAAGSNTPTVVAVQSTNENGTHHAAIKVTPTTNADGRRWGLSYGVGIPRYSYTDAEGEEVTGYSRRWDQEIARRDYNGTITCLITSAADLEPVAHSDATISVQFQVYSATSRNADRSIRRISPPDLGGTTEVTRWGRTTHVVNVEIVCPLEREDETRGASGLTPPTLTTSVTHYSRTGAEIDGDDRAGGRHVIALNLSPDSVDGEAWTLSAEVATIDYIYMANRDNGAWRQGRQGGEERVGGVPQGEGSGQTVANTTVTATASGVEVEVRCHTKGMSPKAPTGQQGMWPQVTVAVAINGATVDGQTVMPSGSAITEEYGRQVVTTALYCHRKANNGNK